MLQLQDLAKQGPRQQTLLVSERLPTFLSKPCTLHVEYKVEAKDKFHLINLHVSGDLTIICQRCMDEFAFAYDNETMIAACRTDERAEQLIDQYECIVVEEGQVALDDLVIDELHLYVPLFHPETSDCSSEINQYLTPVNESY